MSTEPIRRIVAGAREALPDTVEFFLERTWDQVPAYVASPDPGLREDVAAHSDSVFRAVLTTLEEGRRAVREDFTLSPAQAANRVRQGIALPDFLQAFRLGQVTLWESIVEIAARDPETERAALPVAAHVMHVIEVGSSTAAEAYLDTQQTDLAEGDRLRRDLVEDLLAGREIPPGPRLDIARACGLDRDGKAAVLVAVPVRPLRVGQSLRETLRAVRAELGPTQTGVAVIRQEQMIGILPTESDDIESLVPDLRRVHQRLVRQGIELTVGISTVHTGWSGVPDAYAEAGIARGSLAETPGVVALSMLSTVDYLVLRDDPIVDRVIRKELREFVMDDLARDGGMIETLQAYVASDLNAKLAAERLHMHVNTAYYRLDRIAQRTGCDLRRFADVEELVFAVRLLAGPQLAAGFRPMNQ